MQFKVYSLKNAKKILNSGNWISIREPGYKEYYKDIDKIASKNILKLYFDDVDPWRTRNGLIVDFHKSEFVENLHCFISSSSLARLSRRRQSCQFWSALRLYSRLPAPTRPYPMHSVHGW
jgi:hypothetical protein